MIKSWTYLDEYKKYKNQFSKKILHALNSGNIFFGNQLKTFEKNFLRLYKFKYGSAVGSGTDAIYISLKALEIGHGDEVITVSNTAIATVSAIVMSGAKPRFIDVGKDYLINTDLIEEKISKRTKAIICVHLYGQSCNMDKIIKISKKYKLKVIEDCAQAQGAKYKNKYVGSFGDLSCFSFYPTKILGAYGDGGFIVAKNRQLFLKTRLMRFYGIDTLDKKNFFYKKYYSNIHGINSRIDEIQCSILNTKIKKVKNFIKLREIIAKTYYKNLINTDLVLPIKNKFNKHVYHLFVVYHPKRDKILRLLSKNKVNVSIQYPFPIHQMKGYKKLVVRNDKLKNTEKFSKGIFSLPIYPELKIQKVFKIIKILKKILQKI